MNQQSRMRQLRVNRYGRASTAASQTWRRAIQQESSAVATRFRVRIQETWSCVADSAPFTCGNMTVTLVTVIPNNTVTICTVSSVSTADPLHAVPTMLSRVAGRPPAGARNSARDRPDRIE